MMLRTFRLAEPYQMHFDEVYHARTATEFLQDWRYGMSHDIYEWTHPHLAKYAMAGGLVLWGEDNVSATSDLGVPVVAAVVEPRRSTRPATRWHARRRATPRRDRDRDPDVRPPDPRPGLDRRRPPGATALAIDETAQPARHRLRRRTARDDRPRPDRWATAASTRGPQPTDGRPEAPGPPGRPPPRHDDGTYARRPHPTDRLTTIGPRRRRPSTGRIDLPGHRRPCAGRERVALVRRRRRPVTDMPPRPQPAGRHPRGERCPTTRRSSDGRVARHDGRPRRAPGTGDARNGLDAAIADGTLPGVAVEDRQRIAVATAAGVAFIDPDADVGHSTIALDGGAHGLALVTGLDDPKLYATSGRPDEPELRRHRGRWRRGQGRPDRPGPRPRSPATARARARGSPTTRPARWSTSSVSRPA